MLIRFSVSNFLSFKQKTTLEMFASKNRTPPNQVINPEKYYFPKLLKSAFIFGPNASGKTNIIHALDYASGKILHRQALVELTQRNLFFKLDKNCYQEPSSFEFELIAEGQIYKYGFSIKDDNFTHEYLYLFTASLESLIFERKYDDEHKNTYEFGKKYKLWETAEKQYIAKTTPPNQSFLAESVTRNQDDFKPIYNWFNKLLIIFPFSSLTNYSIIRYENLLNLYNSILPNSDIGISGISLDKIEESMFWDKVPQKLKREKLPGQSRLVSVQADNRYFLISDSKESNAYKITINHEIPTTHEQIEFNVAEESEGTNRFFDLIPLLLEAQNDRIVIIDELERSLHSLLAKYWVKLFFELNEQSKGQLIVASHCMELLDVKLIRRDSIWFVQKNREMASVLYSLEEYTKVRNDKELQKAYLSGLYGAVPLIKEKNNAF